MVQETIEAVKKAEAEAEEMIRRASEEGRQLVSNARSEAEAEREKFKQEVSARNSRSELDYAREAEELMRAAMKDKAAEKTPEAVKLIIERLV